MSDDTKKSKLNDNIYNPELYRNPFSREWGLSETEFYEKYKKPSTSKSKDQKPSRNNYFKPPFRTPKEIETITKLEMRIDNLLAPDNIMNSDSVKVLQDQLNKYVLGSETLKTDGMYGNQTHEAVKMYQSDKRYWRGHFAIDANPIRS